MAKPDAKVLVRLDLNNPVFQGNLLDLPKPERHSALETHKKLRQMTWNQVYIDNVLKWEKIASISPPAGINAISSLPILGGLPLTGTGTLYGC